MATVCVDNDCKSYFRGEVVPVAVEVLANSDSSFDVISDGGVRTYCEVKTSSGELITKLDPRIQTVSDINKQLFCSWDTAGLEVGYYILRFWISINISGAINGEGQLVEDYRLASEEIKRYIRLA